MSLRVGIITNSLRDGGAERQAALWARACRDLGHEVTVLALNRGPIDYQLPEGVRLRNAWKSRRLDVHRVAWQVHALGPAVDVVVAFERYPAVLCALTRLPVPWVVVTGDDPRRWRDVSAMPNAVVRAAFRRAAVACAPSQGAVDLHEELGIHPAGAWVRIPNIVTEGAFVTADRVRSGALFVGRLVETKNPFLAIEAALAARVPLTVLGAGELRPAIETLVRAHDDGAITLRPFTREPWGLYGHHRALLVTSRYEIFGNVIVESLAAGTPVVSVDCDFGPREILSGAVYSELVQPGAAALAKALARVAERPYTSQEAEECRAIAERYRAVWIAPLIERTLGEAIAGAR
jgi:glycosyltransferase involved in cell wall biosynthesis